MRSFRLAFILFFLMSCNQEADKSKSTTDIASHVPDSMAVVHHNKSIALLQQYSQFNSDSVNNVLLDSASKYCNNAIRVDSLYMLPYTTYSKVLIRKDSLFQAIRVLEQVESRIPSFAEVIVGQGFVYEKLGDLRSAEKKYRQALTIYEDNLLKDPENTEIQSNIAFIYFFVDNDVIALKEVRHFLSNNPESDQLKFMEQLIINFNREEFIISY